MANPHPDPRAGGKSRAGDPRGIAGVILAAGRSLRMGRPKAFLPLDGETFLARALATLRGGGLDPLVLVCGPHNIQEVREALGLLDPAGARVVVNDQPERGQLSSLRRAFESLAAGTLPAGVVVLPVDHPLVRVETVRCLLEAFERQGRPVVVPVHKGRRGHPVLFGWELYSELMAGPDEGGARRIVRADPSRVVEVIVHDPGILADIDTPEDYRGVSGGLPG